MTLRLIKTPTFAGSVIRRRGRVYAAVRRGNVTMAQRLTRDYLWASPKVRAVLIAGVVAKLHARLEAATA